jgi:hypothetical protein
MYPEQVAVVVSLNFEQRTATMKFINGHQAAQKAYDARNQLREEFPALEHLVFANSPAEEIYCAAHAYRPAT